MPDKQAHPARSLDGAPRIEDMADAELLAALGAPANDPRALALVHSLREGVPALDAAPDEPETPDFGTPEPMRVTRMGESRTPFTGSYSTRERRRIARGLGLDPASPEAREFIADIEVYAGFLPPPEQVALWRRSRRTASRRRRVRDADIGAEPDFRAFLAYLADVWGYATGKKATAKELVPGREGRLWRPSAFVMWASECIGPWCHQDRAPDGLLAEQAKTIIKGRNAPATKQKTGVEA